MKLLRNFFMCTVFALGLLIFSTSLAFADEITVGIVTGSCVNIRQEPSTSSTILGQFYEGDQVTIIGASGDWLNISYGDGNEGWMYGAYVSVRRDGEISRSGDSIDRSLATQVVDYAKQFIGSRYVYGGTTPNGFDCSGFAQYVYKHFGYSINRVASDQASNGISVNKSDLVPGDLVFFHSSGSRYISHVGIYIGNGSFIHASTPATGVRYDSLNAGYYANNYVTARRIIN